MSSNQLSIVFDNLPDLILSKIIDHLSISDRIKIRQLNSRLRHWSLKNIFGVLVGKNKYFLQNMYFPVHMYRIDFDKPKHRHFFQLVLQNEGHTLKYLVLNPYSPVYPAPTSDEIWKIWPQLISQIQIKCPNIVGLCIVCTGYISDEVHFALFQHFGHQLRIAAITQYSQKMNFYNFLCQHLNPNHLIGLCLDDAEDLDKISQHFPLLTKLCVEDGCLEMTAISGLVNLKELCIHNMWKGINFQILTFSSYANSLCRLSVGYECSDFKFELLSRLISLQDFKISLHGCEFLSTICNCLPRLQNLELSFSLRETDRNHLKSGLLAISQLNQLKRLHLTLHYEHPIKFDFNFFRPMSSICCLEIRIYSILKPRDDKNFIYSKLIGLPYAFPNVVHLKVDLGRIPSSVLIKIIAQLTKLKSFTKSWFPKTDTRQLEMFCKQKNIVFKLKRW